ncbi:MAG TPA: pyridoxamine 5'-phosphate oxidase family protein [Nitrososphaeraceae archaeon]|jgi:nitroimidazol reductase NimA-like FMN-containing flavoprotein (pyridoxamine 5'-phosphate oxidase superfamily)|nr:pyridoxamine 5'-phosphate oxidase family protein [Nitrososphaeraceae archaeon]
MSVKDMRKFMTAAAMSKEEIDEFLSTPRIARMATIKDDDAEGKPQPHIVPVWYYYDGKDIFVSTPKGTRKAKNLQNSPNVSIVIDDVVEGKPEDLSHLTKEKAVIIEGKVVEMRDDIGSSFARKMYERYVGKNALDNPMVQFSVNLPRYILVIKPIKIISWDFTKIPPLQE